MSNRNSRAAFALAVACALTVSLLYGRRVVCDLPWLDDWSFVHDLQQHLAGPTSFFAYLFGRHNDHFVVPSRLLFWLLYHATALDLRWLRWLTLGLYVATAVRMTTALRRDLEAATAGGDQPGGAREVLLWLPALAATTTLASWETVSLAMAFTSAVALWSVCAAGLAFARWQRGATRGSLLAAIGWGLLAMGSFAGGALVVVGMAIAATARWRFADRRWATAWFWLLGLGGLGVQMALPASEPVVHALNLDRFALGMLVVAGGPLGWQSEGRPMLLEHGLIGAGLLLGCLLMVVHGWRHRAAMPPWLVRHGLLAGTGLAICIVIVWARHGAHGLDELAASRFVPLVLPLLLGVHGYGVLASVGCPTLDRVVLALCGLALGVAIAADADEYRMGYWRLEVYRRAQHMLTDTPPDALDLATVQARLYLGPGLAQQVVREIVPFLRAERLSLFR